MSQYVIWIDTQKAHIFNLKPEGPVKTHIEKVDIEHHTYNKHDRHDNPHQDQFYHNLADNLKDATALLIVGPGLAKKHFKSYLENHHMEQLAKKIIGMQNSDHPTDNEVLQAARKFFKIYDVFNSPI